MNVRIVDVASRDVGTARSERFGRAVRDHQRERRRRLLSPYRGTAHGAATALVAGSLMLLLIETGTADPTWVDLWAMRVRLTVASPSAGK